MGFGASIILIAAGAILRWGVTDTLDDVNLATIGLILVVVGIIGLLASLIFSSSFRGFGSSRVRRTRTDDGRVYEERVDSV